MYFLALDPKHCIGPSCSSLQVTNQLDFINHTHIILLIHIQTFNGATQVGCLHFLVDHLFLAGDQVTQNILAQHLLLSFPGQQSQRSQVYSCFGIR